MNISTIFQIITVVSLITLTFDFLIKSHTIKEVKKENAFPNAQKAIWELTYTNYKPQKHITDFLVRIRRETMNKLVLPKGRLSVGNVFGSDVYLSNCFGDRIQFFLNVIEEAVYITIKFGNLQIDGATYGKNMKQHLKISNQTNIIINNIILNIRKKSGVQP